MNKLMKKKLMTWEEFEAIFRPICHYWEEKENRLYKYTDIRYRNYLWIITEIEKNKFGTEIKVRKFNGVCYNYISEDNNEIYHKLWFEPEFEPIEFIKEEEMMIE